MTRIQIQEDTEIWSLEDDGHYTIHYVGDEASPRVTVPISLSALLRLAEAAIKEPADRRQLSFRGML